MKEISATFSRIAFQTKGKKEENRFLVKRKPFAQWKINTSRSSARLLSKEVAKGKTLTTTTTAGVA